MTYLSLLKSGYDCLQPALVKLFHRAMGINPILREQLRNQGVDNLDSLSLVMAIDKHWNVFTGFFDIETRKCIRNIFALSDKFTSDNNDVSLEVCEQALKEIEKLLKWLKHEEGLRTLKKLLADLSNLKESAEQGDTPAGTKESVDETVVPVRKPLPLLSEPWIGNFGKEQDWEGEVRKKWFAAKKGTVIAGEQKYSFAFRIIDKLKRKNPFIRVAIIAPSRELQDQWYQELHKCFGFSEGVVRIVGDGPKDFFSNRTRILVSTVTLAAEVLPARVKPYIAKELILIVDVDPSVNENLLGVYSTSRAYTLGLLAGSKTTDYDYSLLGKELGPVIYNVNNVLKKPHQQRSSQPKIIDALMSRVTQRRKDSRKKITEKGRNTAKLTQTSFRFLSVEPRRWTGRFSLPQKNEGCLYNITYIDEKLGWWPVIDWVTERSQIRLLAIPSPDVKLLTKAVYDGKMVFGSKCGGRFIINEFGQVLVPPNSGSNEDAYIVGEARGNLLFGCLDQNFVIDLSSTQGLTPGDYWNKPPVGMIYYLDSGNQIKSIKGHWVQFPSHQDANLIQQIRRFCGKGEVKLLVNPYKVVFALNTGPLYVGKVDITKWFVKESQ